MSSTDMPGIPVLEDRGLIYDATSKPDLERIAFFTGLCPLKSGTILSGFFIGPGKHAPVGTIRVCRSRDAGQTWAELPFVFETRIDGVPGSLAGAEIVETEPGRLALFSTWFDRSEPERPLFDPVSEGLLRSRQLMAVSHDEGDTWSAWQVVPTPGLTGTALTGPPIRWDDGTLALPFESFKEFDDPRPARHAAWLLISRDGALTFEPPYLVAQHPEHVAYYWDQRLCAEKQPGEYFALFWTHHRGEKRDLRVHQLWGSIATTAASRPQPDETSLPGQIAAPLLWDDGRVFAFVVDRAQPGTLTLWQSGDRGTTWPRDRALVVHQHDECARLSQGPTNIDFAQYWEDMGKWSFGHPAIRKLDENHVLLAFYAGTPERMSVHWARVRV